jgi:hypothetical protein
MPAFAFLALLVISGVIFCGTVAIILRSMSNGSPASWANKIGLVFQRIAIFLALIAAIAVALIGTIGA